MADLFESDVDLLGFGYTPNKDLNQGWHFSHTEPDPDDPLKTIAVLTKGSETKLVPY